jgi:SHS2 domain-containing protein
MADPETVGSTWQHVIELADEEPAALLFDWLSDIVYWKDAAGVVFNRAELMLTRQDDGRWIARGTLYGEPVNGSAQTLRADVKGITKHLYRLAPEEEQWTVRVVLDV